MEKGKTGKRNPAETRRRVVDAAMILMLRQGYAATSVDQVCAEAGLTKGSFFHYFKSKEDVGRAAMAAFACRGTELYAPAWSAAELDPLEGLHRLIDIMIGFTRMSEEDITCLVGMMSQEMSSTNPAMREACARHLTDWTNMVRKMLDEARALYPVRSDFDSEEVAWMLNALWQGSMLIGKARHAPGMIASNLNLARGWIDSLFDRDEGETRLSRGMKSARKGVQPEPKAKGGARKS